MSNSGSSVKFRDPPVEDVLDENSHFYPPAGDESDDDDMMLHDEQQQAEETEHARMSRKKKKQQTDDEEEKSDRMLSQQCRFYEKTFPEVEEVVMVHILNIGEMGAYVKLLEYNNIEGMVLLSELSRRRIRSINKLLRVGTNEPVMVVRVDQEKGYIDLSKRRVSSEDRAKCEDRYNKAKTVHSILRHVSEAAQTSLQDVYERIGWPLYRSHGHAYDAFQRVVIEPDTVLQGLEISSLERQTLLDHIHRKMAPQPVRVRADIDVTCLHYDGIDAIKEALLAGKALSTSECEVDIQLVSPPTYVLLTKHISKDTAIEKLHEVMKRIHETIIAKQGSMTVSQEPYVASAEDEKQLAHRLGQLSTQQNEEEEDDD